MKKLFLLLNIAILTIFTQCDTVRNLPTNTSGGVFSLNGQWQLTQSGEQPSMEGMVINVVPGFSNANIVTLPTVNTYCFRERDDAWKNITSDKSGGFIADFLVGACTGSPQYKPGTIAVISNDEIRVKTMSIDNKEMLQTYKRKK